MKLPLMLLPGVLFLSLVGSSFGQQPAPFVVEPPPNAAYPDYGPGNVVASRLRREPPKMFTFDRASLRDTLRYLADDAGIPFVGIPESDTANRRLVTFTMEASPFTALESVCRDNGIRLTYENGVWYMRTVDEERERRLKEENENKLVGIAYRLRYDPVDRVDFRMDADPSQSNGGGSQSNSGGTSITATGANMPLQNSQRVFAAKAPRIINEIRVMLGLPPISYGPDGSVIGEVVNAGTNVQSTTSTVVQEVVSNTPQMLNPTYVPPQMPQVIYNSDTNTLWVVATRAQHKWVADYLMAVDQPQVLIAIEVKFFETTKNPSKEFGINWKGTMHPDPLTGDGGIKLTASQITVSPSGTLSVDSTGSRTVNTGSGDSTQAGTIPQDSSEANRATQVSIAAPYSAVLTSSDVQLALQAFMSDDKTSIVQYPRVLTINNREVAITSAENTPINAGVTQVATGGVAPQNIGTLGYLPVGTQINILPKSVGIDQIALTVAITISDILRFEPLNLGTGSNLYPVTSERVYNASLQVNSGYTLAVGGLETTGDTRFNNGIPLLQDIPGVGHFFRSKTRSRKKKNLIVFITPTIIANPKATRGIGETPEAVVPIRPNDPTPPAFTPDGQLVGGYDAINAAFAWFDFQVKWFQQTNKENRTDKTSIRQLRAVIASARMLVRDIARMQETADPVRAEQFARLEERAVATLTELNRVLSVAQDNVM
ncbi:MAG: hypothetical protein WC076_07890 [Terrimicrobiaceae bacterium]